ncbi:hypothetical protein [Alicyclobacillus sp. ALC3]|uniref:hypothetical protein n=1 Tax=Alicyclobacillus sp. ALC3 TaxID=2796143 RepID=UPI002379A26E|nr:hypothetical protein [Alicyclobacillus sp. ALC3]WDL95733.1 hypothetical protein JC200_15340 [Alicyclobacillus sp. ALC3]
MEMIFLFFADTVFELGSFSVLHVNLQYIQVNPGVANSISNLTFRLIELPLLLVTTSNLLLNPAPILKWGGVISIVLFTVMVQQILVWMGVLSMHHWNVAWSGVIVCVAVLASRIMAGLIRSTSSHDAA